MGGDRSEHRHWGGQARSPVRLESFSEPLPIIRAEPPPSRPSRGRRTWVGVACDAVMPGAAENVAFAEEPHQAASVSQTAGADGGRPATERLADGPPAHRCSSRIAARGGGKHEASPLHEAARLRRLGTGVRIAEFIRSLVDPLVHDAEARRKDLAVAVGEAARPERRKWTPSP